MKIYRWILLFRLFFLELISGNCAGFIYSQKFGLAILQGVICVILTCAFYVDYRHVEE